MKFDPAGLGLAADPGAAPRTPATILPARRARFPAPGGPPCPPCGALAGQSTASLPHAALRPCQPVFAWSTGNAPMRIMIYRCHGCGGWMRRPPTQPGDTSLWRIEPPGR